MSAPHTAYAEVNRLRTELDRSRADLSGCETDYTNMRTERDGLQGELDCLRAAKAAWAEERDRLRAENERLVGIIANVCLALGYEESAWPAHWQPHPDCGGAELPAKGGKDG